MSENRSEFDSSRRFATTSWTVIGQAASDGTAEAGPALQALCQRYWFPLYAYARRKGASAADAEDLTQSFFLKFVEDDLAAKADPHRGRFRAFLLSAFQNFMTNQFRRETAEKRGGGVRHWSLDFSDADRRYRGLEDDETAERTFDRQWALALLRTTMDSVAQQYQSAGKSEWFALLRPCLTGTQSNTYRELAETMGIREGAVKAAVFRLRERFAQQLRMQIARTVSDPEEVEAEIRDLLALLR